MAQKRATEDQQEDTVEKPRPGGSWVGQPDDSASGGEDLGFDQTFWEAPDKLRKTIIEPQLAANRESRTVAELRDVRRAKLVFGELHTRDWVAEALA